MSDSESAGIEPVERSDPVKSAREFLLGVPAWLDNWHMSHKTVFCIGKNRRLEAKRVRPAFGETREESLQDWQRELMNAIAMEAANRGA